MYRKLGEDFKFIGTGEMEEWRKGQGWEKPDTKPYVIEAGEHPGLAHRLAADSEVVILGSAPEEYFKVRMKEQKGGITFRYSERIYKGGRWRCLSPRGLLLRINSYYRYRNRKLYMLCASAYTSADLLLQGAYLGRCYRWGYYPETIYYQPGELSERKSKNGLRLLWCGRLVEYKHVETVAELAFGLKQEGYEFELQIIGSGDMESRLRLLLQEYGLESMVRLSGSMTAKEVRRQMEEADIFVLTSDFREGWGAVVNEAMNSGCAVIASHAAGAAPFLLKDGWNGYIYENGNPDSLKRKAAYLLCHRQVCEEVGRRAYETIVNEWNAQTAAERLLLLIEDLQAYGTSERFRTGPCSKAEILWNSWYKD